MDVEDSSQDKALESRIQTYAEAVIEQIELDPKDETPPKRWDYELPEEINKLISTARDSNKEDQYLSFADRVKAYDRNVSLTNDSNPGFKRFLS